MSKEKAQAFFDKKKEETNDVFEFEEDDDDLF